MGGWDYYCGICGGPLSPPYWDPEEQDEHMDGDGENSFGAAEGYNPEILSSPEDPQLEWLGKFRVVTETPQEYQKSAPE